VVAALWVVVASIYRSAHGETADQILAKKRAPWSLPRPYLASRQPPVDKHEHKPEPEPDSTVKQHEHASGE
jgi:hypothetical protein